MRECTLRHCMFVGRIIFMGCLCSYHFYVQFLKTYGFFLMQDLPGMVAKIASFLERPLSADAIDAISNHCTFEQMKSNNMVNREVLPISDLFDMTQSKFMRKGIIGDWKNYFTEEQNIDFSKLYNEKMEGSGLEIIFDPEEIDNRNNNGGNVANGKLDNMQSET
ncbi:UNVERIFIED_CONTAM: Sult1b1 [Trichonephila clavipes]